MILRSLLSLYKKSLLVLRDSMINIHRQGAESAKFFKVIILRSLLPSLQKPSGYSAALRLISTAKAFRFAKRDFLEKSELISFRILSDSEI